MSEARFQPVASVETKTGRWELWESNEYGRGPDGEPFAAKSATAVDLWFSPRGADGRRWLKRTLIAADVPRELFATLATEVRR